MLHAHPDNAQGAGGQTTSPQVADARQEQPDDQASSFRTLPGGRCAIASLLGQIWLEQRRGDRPRGHDRLVSSARRRAQLRLPSA